MTTKAQLLTIADWDAIPYDEWHRYEIIEGELFVSEPPGLRHQIVLGNLVFAVGTFLRTNRIGTFTFGPGVVLGNHSGVIPDAVYFSNKQRDQIVMNDRLHGPPDIIVEILALGSTDIGRDRIAKFQLYAKHSVREYWIVDPVAMTLEKYVNQNSSLLLEKVFRSEDALTSAVLPEFSCPMSKIFER